jgi:Malectin domain
MSSVCHFQSWPAKGSRVFDVTVAGTKITNLDVVALSGGKNVAYTTTLTVTTTGPTLTIAMVASTDKVTISAIEIRAVVPAPTKSPVVAAPKNPVAAPTSPVAAPMSPIAAPKSPVAAPMSPVAAPMSPVAAPTSPVAAPTSPVAAPKSPVAAPAAPSSTISPVWIDCGSSSSFTDSQNRLWLADVYYDLQSGVFNTTSAIANTVDDKLYQTERTGVTVGYNIPRPSGTYAVTLHFAEI